MAAMAKTRPPKETMLELAPFPGGPLGVVLEEDGAVPDRVAEPLVVKDAVELEKPPLVVGTVPLVAPEVGTGTTRVPLPVGTGTPTLPLPEGTGMKTPVPVVGTTTLVEPGEGTATEVAGGAWIWPSLIWVMGRMVDWARAWAAKAARTIVQRILVVSVEERGSGRGGINGASLGN